MATSSPRPDLAQSLAETHRNQARAAAPDMSAWVGANAGTGKTHVLTTRVVRLLLAGTPPERILALTFTKAAAAEMSTRIFNRLATWVTAPVEDLTKILRDITGTTPTTEQLAHARRLFARSIETPGGLKVQTIHSFCERVLQRFPLEAGVPPGFQVLDEQQRDEILRAAIDDMLAAAMADGGALRHALDTAIAFAVDDLFDERARRSPAAAQLACDRDPARYRRRSLLSRAPPLSPGPRPPRRHHATGACSRDGPRPLRRDARLLRGNPRHRRQE